MSDKGWYVPNYRNALFGSKFRVVRVKWSDFAGVCLSLDHRSFWTRNAAQKRAEELNRRAAEVVTINARVRQRSNHERKDD